MGDHTEALTAEAEGPIQFSGDMTEAEEVLVCSLERAAEMDTEVAIVCLITGPQLDVLASRKIGHAQMAELFYKLAEAHYESAKAGDSQEQVRTH